MKKVITVLAVMFSVETLNTQFVRDCLPVCTSLHLPRGNR